MSKNKYYFTKDHENAILDYVKTKDSVIRTELYVNFIYPSLNEMIDKIVFSYKFNNLPNIAELREECLLFLITILDKFNVNAGYKAFSYFSVITKNYFINKVKNNTLKSKKEIQYETLRKDIEEYKVIENEYLANRERNEFFDFLKDEMERWENLKLKENERKVLEAIKIIVGDINNREIFNKKKFYFDLKEITKLDTKQMIISLNFFRKKYKKYKKKWDNGLVK